MTDVSFGGVSIGADGTLGGTVNSSLVRLLASMGGVRSHPLISCGGAEKTRAFLGNESAVDQFIDAAVSLAASSGISGYNLDLEPYDAPTTAADAAAYASFVDKFARRLHSLKTNCTLSLDYFSNLPFWDLGKLAATEVDYLISMDTYVPGNTSFTIYYNIAESHIPAAKLGVGMCAATRPPPFTPYGPDPCPVANWTAADLSERFAFLEGAAGDFAMINLWVLPFPDNWWEALRSYGYGMDHA